MDSESIFVSCDILFYSVHYKEYLVSLINQNDIDPAVEMGLGELQQTLRRNGIQIPDGDADQQIEMYLAQLRQVWVDFIDDASVLGLTVIDMCRGRYVTDQMCDVLCNRSVMISRSTSDLNEFSSA